ncbi:MAG: SNF2 helicase associated domain-containing protein [Blautia sp.]|nr:SNF2 helicase associated domain-containing protein [Blautia sp.]
MSADDRKDEHMTMQAEDSTEQEVISLTENGTEVIARPRDPDDPDRETSDTLDELITQEHEQIAQAFREENAALFPAEEYRYFQSEGFFKGLNVPLDTIKKARELIRNQECLPMEVSLGFEEDVGSERQMGEARLLSVSRSYFEGWQVRIRFTSHKIVYSACTKYSCYSVQDKNSTLKHTICHHQAAAILLLQEYLEDNNIGDATNRSGMALLNHMLYSPKAALSLVATDAPQLLSIVPSLEVEHDNSISASFRIGQGGKFYKIKMLGDIIQKIREGKKETFGKNTVFSLSRESLDPDSLSVFSFLEEIAEEDREINERFRNLYGGSYYQPVTLPEMKSSVQLLGSRLDRFFELMNGKSLEVTVRDAISKEKSSYLFRDQDFQPKLEIARDLDEKTGYFQGIVITGDLPEMIEGRRSAYYFSQDKKGCYFNRVPHERFKALEPLVQAGHGGYVRMCIGRNHLSDFYYKTLPQLREIADIVEYDIEEIARYLPPEPTFLCYLDYMKDTVICRAEVTYGPQIFSLTDLLDQEQDRIGSGVASYRDQEAEGNVLRVICKYLTNYDRDLHLLSGTRDEEQVFAFLSYGIGELMEVCEVRATERFKRLRVRKSVKFDIGVSVSSGIMNLSILSEDLSQEELLEILFQYREKRRFVRLRNGDFLRLDAQDTIAQLAQMLDVLGVSVQEFVKGKMSIPAYRALYLDKMLESVKDVYLNRDVHFRKLIKEFKTVEDADFEIPEELKGVLRKYQETGFQWLCTLDHYNFGGILADEMGLGKTLQVITVMLSVKHREKEFSEEHFPSLIICPASLVFNWGEELRRFAPELKVLLLSGTQGDRREKLAIYRQADVLVTSYDLLKRDIADYEGKQFRFQVIDEAQYIKNHDTAAAKSVKLIQARTKYALTGTPIENRLSELWSIFDYLMPGFLYDYDTFRNNYELPIVKYQKEEAQMELQRMVTPFILRRLKRDVLKDLPDKLVELRFAQMDVKQQNLYDGQVVKMKSKFAGKSETDFRRMKLEFLAELMKLRQICCDPNLCFEDFKGQSAKREMCMELVRNLADGGHKALIFSQFTSMLDLLAKDLEKEHIPFYTITGSTPKERRLTLVKAFNEDETPVFLISLRAGGTGLNLVGADVVIHYDPWWNIAVENQATDRAHRIGQVNVVTVYKLVTKGTIEERIIQMQEDKQKLADDILSGEGISSGTLNQEDLMALLE